LRALPDGHFAYPAPFQASRTLVLRSRTAFLPSRDAVLRSRPPSSPPGLASSAPAPVSNTPAPASRARSAPSWLGKPYPRHRGRHPALEIGRGALEEAHPTLQFCCARECTHHLAPESILRTDFLEMALHDYGNLEDVCISPLDKPGPAGLPWAPSWKLSGVL
jgi:hypothetical protein